MLGPGSITRERRSALQPCVYPASAPSSWHDYPDDDARLVSGGAVPERDEGLAGAVGRRTDAHRQADRTEQEQVLVDALSVQF